MAALTVQNIVIDGAVKSALVAATAAGDTFVNDGKTFLEVLNGDVSPMTVTIVGQRNLPLGVSSTKTVTVTNATTQMIGPFPVGNYNRETDESVEVTYSSVTSLTVGAYSVNDEFN